MDWNHPCSISWSNSLWSPLSALYVSARALKHHKEDVEYHLTLNHWLKVIELIAKVEEYLKNCFPRNDASMKLPGRWPYWKAEALAQTKNTSLAKIEIG
jgi:hypothetical protein